MTQRPLKVREYDVNTALPQAADNTDVKPGTTSDTDALTKGEEPSVSSEISEISLLVEISEKEAENVGGSDIATRPSDSLSSSLVFSGSGKVSPAERSEVKEINSKKISSLSKAKKPKNSKKQVSSLSEEEGETSASPLPPPPRTAGSSGAAQLPSLAALAQDKRPRRAGFFSPSADTPPPPAQGNNTAISTASEPQPVVRVVSTQSTSTAVKPKKPGPWERLREAAIASGEYVVGAPTTVAEDKRDLYPRDDFDSGTSPADASGGPQISNPTGDKGGDLSVAVPKVHALKGEAISLHSELGLPKPEKRTAAERAEQEAYILQCQKSLQQAREQGLIPPPIWDALPSLTLPTAKQLSPTMTLEGQVERLLRAYRGVCFKRFGKHPKERFAAKQALKSAAYGELLKQAVLALLECKIAPIQWVDWAVHQWVEKRFKGKFEWAKLPPMQWVFAPQMILPMRHTFRGAVRNNNLLNFKFNGPAAKKLDDLAMREERVLGGFSTVEALVDHWQNSALGSRYSALLEAAKLEQFQYQQTWERKMALGEWVDEWQ